MIAGVIITHNIVRVIIIITHNTMIVNILRNIVIARIIIQCLQCRVINVPFALKSLIAQALEDQLEPNSEDFLLY